MRANEVEATEQWSLPGQDAASIRVATPCGAIRVKGVEAEQIEVRAVRQVRAAREEEARAFLELMQIDRRLEGDRWIIEATWPEARRHGVESPQTQFELRVPTRMGLEAETGHGAVDANDVSSARL